MDHQLPRQQQQQQQQQQEFNQQENFNALPGTGAQRLLKCTIKCT